MTNWSGLDFFIFLIMAVCTIRGMARGAIKEMISLMCLSVALIFAIKFTVPLSKFMLRSPLISDVLSSPNIQYLVTSISSQPLSENFIPELSFSISLLICFVGIFSICEAALTRTGVVQALSMTFATLSAKIGGALGFVRGYVFSVFFIIVLALHLFSANNGAFQGSYFLSLFQSSAVQMDNIIESQDVGQYQQIYKNSNSYNASDLTNALTPPINSPGQP
jgi:uncharacterized membrane protein required for colicin V production